MKINTALILCAGYGKRLNPLTLNEPKPLLKINKITLLENCIHLIESLGIKKVILNTFYLKDKIENFFATKKFDLDINFKLIENISMVTRMPFCYGGGVQNIDQASKIFSFGVEKISISSSVFKNLNLIKEISSEFGQQSIAVTLDINQDLNKNYFIIILKFFK